MVAVDTITVGERSRKDLGDLTGLMQSIQTVGLIHPNVVTDDLQLVAGARRLEATKRLGATMIEVRRVGDLTEEERIVIELEENLHRKNLTPPERSRTTARLAEAVAAQRRGREETQAPQGMQPNEGETMDTQTHANPGPDEFSPTAGNNSNVGRPERPDAQAQVAEEIGISQQALSLAQQHVQAMTRYPELDAPDVSQREALRCWKAWEKMTAVKRTRARQAWRKRQAEKRELAQAKAEAKAKGVKGRLIVRQPRPRKRRPRQTRSRATIPPTRPWYVFVAGLQQVIMDFEHGGGLVPLFEVWTVEEFERAKQQLASQMAQLERISRNLEAGQVISHGTSNLRVMRGQDE
jgi:ParB family chromosome partitioning protein